MLRDGKVPDESKCGRISFVPKTKLPAKPSDLRPICLTSTVAKLFGRILIHRMRKFLPACHALQLGCQPGRQAMDGINTVRAAKSISQKSGRPLCCAKLDIKAAFDSLSHRAILQYLRQGAPNLESLALWDLLYKNEVLLEVGGHSWKQLLTQGILQGTSYSAELFSRVTAWNLAPVITQLQTRDPIVVGGVSFPPLLMYADDILLLGTGPADLQARLRLVQANLSTIGLHLNLNKCSTLQGEQIGIWGLRSCTPLTCTQAFIFLGLPIGYRVSGEDTLFHCLRKTQGSFFAFKRIMDSSRSSLATKVSIFNTYISSRWLWASPAVFPTTVLLRRIDAMRNTLLLSLLRLPTDGLLDWVTNEVSRRRSVRILCDSLMPQWGRQWLSRYWAYWGHAARESKDSPIRVVISCVNWFRIRRGRTPAAGVVDADVRKIQKAYDAFRHRYLPSYWEHAGEDRIMWDNLLQHWLGYWIQPFPSPFPGDYLMGKQLVAVDTFWATLRPARALPFEAPYLSHFLHIKPIHKDFWKRKGILFFLIAHADLGISVVVGSAGLQEDRRLVAQLPPQWEHAGNNLLSGLLVLSKLIDITRQDYKGLVTVVMQPVFLNKQILSGNTNKLDPVLFSQWNSGEYKHDILCHTFLPPRKIPEAFRYIFMPTYNPTPARLLHRSWNFSQARYISFGAFLTALLSLPNLLLAPLCFRPILSGGGQDGQVFPPKSNEDVSKLHTITHLKAVTLTAERLTLHVADMHTHVWTVSCISW